MTERGRNALSRDAARFVCGPSSLAWEDGSLVVRFREMSLPWPPGQLLARPIRGQITVKPLRGPGPLLELHPNGRHFWRAEAPLARISARIEGEDGPGWEGDGYIDGNWGAEPLEAGFDRWDWSRGATRDGAVVLYDATRRDGSRQLTAIRFDRDGAASEFDPPPHRRLGRGFWGVEQFTRCDEGRTPRIVRQLEDGPFYTRSTISTWIGGEPIAMMHESYSGRRFSSPLVKAMLPVRMPRRRG